MNAPTVAEAAQQLATDWGGLALFVTSLAGFITSLGTVVIGIMNRGKLVQNDAAMSVQSEALEEIRAQTNGLHDELKQAARAEGRLEGHTAGTEGKP